MSNLPKVRKCQSQYCYNDTPSGSGNGKYCSTCRSRQQKVNNPLRFILTTLKHNAKRRKVFFDLSLQGLIETIEGTEYLIKRGRRKEDLTLDRIIPELGYTDGNLQVITNSENAAKRWRDQYPAKYDHEVMKAKAGTPF